MEQKDETETCKRGRERANLSGFRWISWLQRKGVGKRRKEPTCPRRCCVKAPPSVGRGRGGHSGGLGLGARGGAASPTRGRVGLQPPSRAARVPARVRARGGTRPICSHRRASRGPGTKGPRASRGTRSSVRAGARTSPGRPGRARSPRCRARGTPPSIPGRDASVHTRGFFKNNIFLYVPPAPHPHLRAAAPRAGAGAGPRHS